VQPALFIPLVFLLYSPFAMSGTSEACSKVAELAAQDKAKIPGYISGRKVIGKGRLYFYTAPDTKCRMKNTFVIPHDRVEAYSDYGDFTQIVYWDAKGNDVEGWVPSNRLAETGTGIGNKEEVERKK
jgi:hypothetical protein